MGATGFPVGVAALVEESGPGCIRSRQRVGGVVASGGRTNDAQAAACWSASVGLTHHDPPDFSKILLKSICVVTATRFSHICPLYFFKITLKSQLVRS